MCCDVVRTASKSKERPPSAFSDEDESRRRRLYTTGRRGRAWYLFFELKGISNTFPKSLLISSTSRFPKHFWIGPARGDGGFARREASPRGRLHERRRPVVFFSSLSRFGAFRGSRVAIVRMHSNSTKKPQHDGTPSYAPGRTPGPRFPRRTGQLTLLVGSRK